MTEFEVKRAFLFSYLNERKEETRLLDELEQMRTRLMKTSPDLSGMPRSGQERDLADGIQRIIDAEDRLDAQLLHSMEAREEVYKAILTVPDARQRLVLSWRFLNGKKLEDLPDVVHYSIQHVKRLYRDGVNAVQLPVKDETK